ncbi:hypothetical protein Xen7305DRAFT_00003830 [Xenococcus sp. PCC 7305]|uniref:Uma2 family endonuclease n=1 Tax=Xenococcus sp. PCC 7305 TaxID=102125 RepID=UPI0002ABE438|nr:Uma2 family endonuclease [Xenococcus sp. PCC 7305]ELS00682.1 hypothetical protein Xen7305DRAFT_00003830 [Xenococcus sp. PCC 7305]
MLITTSRADRVILQNINWQQFEDLLLDLGSRSGTRLAYDQGTLEIMNPLPEHEYYKEVIGDVVKDLAEELELDYESLGSTTWKLKTQLAGVEPDNCFYFQNETLVRGQLNFDLDRDPPPDLVLEIDLTSKSLPRFPIYARLKVMEIWCYESGTLTIYLLKNGEYLKAKKSLIFPHLPIQQIPNLIEKSRTSGRRAIRQAVRHWVRENVD